MKEKKLIQKIYSKREINRMERKVKLLGFDYPYSASSLLTYRFIINIILFLMCFIFLRNGFVIGLLSVFMFHFLSEYIILDYPIKKRAKRIESDAIFFLEVLILTLESGRNLRVSLSNTAQNIQSELSKEFQKSLTEMNYGKSFQECLYDMRERIPSEAVSQIILHMIESSQAGSNMKDTLNYELDYLRDRKSLEMKSKIHQLPIKVCYITILFFIPLIMGMIVIPIWINSLISG